METTKAPSFALPITSCYCGYFEIQTSAVSLA